MYEDRIIYDLELERANVVIGSSVSKPKWGNIEGNLEDQTDLVNKLTAIQNLIPDKEDLNHLKEELALKANITDLNILENKKANSSDVYTKSEINSKGYLKVETDPTVPTWAKQPNKPTYTADEVGALPNTTVIPDTSIFATKSELNSKANTSDIPNKISQLSNDIGYISNVSNLATKSELAHKVDKVSGKSLISDAEITRLSTIANYDDTEIRTELSKKANTSELSKYSTIEESDSKYQVKGNYLTSIPSNYVTEEQLPVIDSALSSSSTNAIQNKAVYNAISNKADSSYLNGKVDKVEGKSLILDTEIARLSLVHNYDDTEIQNAIAIKANADSVYTKEQIDSKLASTYKYKGSVANYNSLPSVAEIGDVYNLLDTGANYAYAGDDEGWDNLSGIVDLSEYIKAKEVSDNYVLKISGKSLISDSEISRLANVTNYNDSSIRSEISIKANSADVYTKAECDSKFITDHQSLADYALKSEIPDISGLATKDELSIKANKTDIPNSVSQLTNDVGYITTIPNEYVTKTELATKADKADVLTKVDAESTYQIKGNYATVDQIPTTLPANGGNADTVNGKTVEAHVPANAVFTDTLYDDTLLNNRVATIENQLTGLNDLLTQINGE